MLYIARRMQNVFLQFVQFSRIVAKFRQRNVRNDELWTNTASFLVFVFFFKENMSCRRLSAASEARAPVYVVCMFFFAVKQWINKQRLVAVGCLIVSQHWYCSRMLFCWETHTVLRRRFSLQLPRFTSALHQMASAGCPLVSDKSRARLKTTPPPHPACIL